jgi:hypothetical protein
MRCEREIVGENFGKRETIKKSGKTILGEIMREKKKDVRIKFRKIAF